jgi:excisionase family DNA binding protein
MPQKKREPRITNLATHPRRYVGLIVAAKYLEIDWRTLNKLLDNGVMAFSLSGGRRRIETAELAAYEERERRPRRAS